MAWVPFEQSRLAGQWILTGTGVDNSSIYMTGSTVYITNADSWWEFSDWYGNYPTATFRLLFLRYESSGDLTDNPGHIYYGGGSLVNQASDFLNSYLPSPLDISAIGYLGMEPVKDSTGQGHPYSATIFVEVWDDGDPGPGPTPSSSEVRSEGFHVYEIDKGWSFDGAYIPHFAELNWYFGEDPFTDKSIQKVRIHGLSKGRTFLSMAVAGMQVDYDQDFTEPQHIDLPLNAAHISTEFIPTTNYVDSSNWGVSLQLRFEGRNTDLARPEPSHVLQVLALQGSPQGNGARNN